MEALRSLYLVYPDPGPVKFLFWMLCVIAFAIWIGMKEDRK